MERGRGELAAHFEKNGMLIGRNWSPFKFSKNPKNSKKCFKIVFSFDHKGKIFRQ